MLTIAGILSKSTIFTRICSIISKYSYAIFLVHHVIQQLLDAHFAGTNITRLELLLIFILYLLLTGIMARLLYQTNEYCCKFVKGMIRPDSSK